MVPIDPISIIYIYILIYVLYSDAARPDYIALKENDQ
jgi:hypothetical protein